MVYKTIRSKKTPGGYSVWVNFKDGAHVKPLIQLIGLYFVEVEKAQNPEYLEQISLSVDKQISDLKRAEVEK